MIVGLSGPPSPTVAFGQCQVPGVAVREGQPPHEAGVLRRAADASLKPNHIVGNSSRTKIFHNAENTQPVPAAASQSLAMNTAPPGARLAEYPQTGPVFGNRDQ